LRLLHFDCVRLPWHANMQSLIMKVLTQSVQSHLLDIKKVRQQDPVLSSARLGQYRRLHGLLLTDLDLTTGSMGQRWALGLSSSPERLAYA